MASPDVQVELDEKGPIELLQLLNNVLSHIDPVMKSDVRKEDEQKGTERIMDFLILLRYPILEDESERKTWIQNLLVGSKDAVYPILAWCLPRLEKLKKRAYLAPFLIPIDLPMEIAMSDDGTLMKLTERYRNLQSEFKDAHHHHESIKAEFKENDSQSLKSEINQLKNEKKQLKDRINDLNEKVKIDNDFKKLLDATSSLRKEQDQEVRLRDQALEQSDNLFLEEEKLKQLQKRYKSLNSINISEMGSIDALLLEIQSEVRETKIIVRSDLTIERNKIQKKIEKYEQERKEPTRTEDDLEHLQEAIGTLEKERDGIEKQLLKLKDGNKASKISMYKQVCYDIPNEDTCFEIISLKALLLYFLCDNMVLAFK